MPRPKDTPLGLLERDLGQTLRLHQETRNLIQEQVQKLKFLLDSELPIQTRLDIIEALVGMSESLTKSMQQSARFVMAGDSEGSSGSSDDSTLEELLLGKSKVKPKQKEGV